MKPMERIVVFAPLLTAWILFWLLMPVDPGHEYSTFDWTFLVITVIAGVVALVRWFSEHVQQENGDRIRRALDRHDRRTNR